MSIPREGKPFTGSLPIKKGAARPPRVKESLEKGSPICSDPATTPEGFAGFVSEPDTQKDDVPIPPGSMGDRPEERGPGRACLQNPLKKRGSRAVPKTFWLCYRTKETPWEMKNAHHAHAWKE